MGEEHSGIERPAISEVKTGEIRVMQRESRLIFFSMLLFAALTGLYALIAFTYLDFIAATWLSVAALSVLGGVVFQIVSGLKTWVRFFYGLCGVTIFILLVVRGGVEHMALLGALGLVPGFLVVLRWRLGVCFLSFLAAFCATVFYGDFYLNPDEAFPPLVEIKFFVAYSGLCLFMAGYVYNQEVSARELILTNREVNALAYKDPLTGLPNRRAVEDMLEKRWEEYRRTGHLFAVLMVNVDNFKSVNDQFGYDFGDGILLRLANVLVRAVRAQDIISRWGGDEFLLILPGQTQVTALKVAERLLRRVAEVEVIMQGEPLRITVSIGVSSVNESLDAGDVVSLADNGLFQAKHTGKNKVVAG